MENLLQMIQWKYSGDPRGAQYSESIKKYRSLNTNKRDRLELKKILLFLAKIYRDNIKNTDTLIVIMSDINEYYQYLDETEKKEYQKLIVKMEEKNG